MERLAFQKSWRQLLLLNIQMGLIHPFWSSSSALGKASGDPSEGIQPPHGAAHHHTGDAGASGHASVEFEGGNRIELRPDTALVIRKAGGSTAQFGAVLLRGGATASSAGRGVLLAIGTPFGLT